MSYTEIFAFGKDGKVCYQEETRNAFRGAMAVWDILDKKHLEPLPKPSWMDEERYQERGYSRSSAGMGMGTTNHLKEVWDLWTQDIPMHDRLVLGTTFDNVVLKRENMAEVIEHMKKFSEENENTSIGEQADILQSFLDDDDEVIAVAWNQTSVSADTWDNYDYDEDGESISYNLNEHKEHWYLFDDLKQNS